MININKRKRSIGWVILKSTILLICISIVTFVMFIAPPGDINGSITVEIEEGSSLATIAEQMREENVIRSSFWFRIFVILYKGEHIIPAGDYYFHEPAHVHHVARRIVEGDHGKRPMRVTIIEGWGLERIAGYLDERFENFDREVFFSLAKEGYLAPDTYFFFPSITTEMIVDRMERNFETRLNGIKEDKETDRSIEDIIIMASILEAEANTVESKRKVADILWRRYDAGMPLQVDATFIYVNNKNTYQLTLEDLQIDNPYNTYLFTGLPPTPINNPGANAIKAAMDPLENPYWYFLSDLAGNMYYAEDFDGHQYNRANYLRQ